VSNGSPSTIVAILASFTAVLADRPEKRPGNLAPMQLITALGAWVRIIINSIVAAVACAFESAALAGACIDLSRLWGILGPVRAES